MKIKDNVGFEHTKSKLNDNFIIMYDEYLKLPFGVLETEYNCENM